MEIASGGVYWAAGNQTVASLSDLGGSGGKVMDNTASSTAILTLAPSAGTTTFSGTLQNTGGTLALVLAGTGTQVLAGNSTYSGGTTIQSGVLSVSNDDNLGATTGTTSGADAQRRHAPGERRLHAECFAAHQRRGRRRHQRGHRKPDLRRRTRWRGPRPAA